MKRISIAVFAAIILCSTVRNANALGIMASWWQVSESSDDGFGVGLRERIQLIPLVGIDVRASWIDFGEDFSVYPLEAAGVVSLGPFYAGIGAGYYLFDSPLDDAFGWYVIGGAEIALGGFGVFGDLMWRDLSPDYEGVDASLDDVPTSLDAAGVGFNLGISFGL